MRDPTREAAYDLLTAVLIRHRSLEEALDALPAMDARDRAAGHRLAAAVLRRTATLDAVLEPFLRREPPDPVRLVLRLGAAGLLLLETPTHAAVATSVELARAKGLTPFTGLVNAVLRKVAAISPAMLQELDSPRLDTPDWMWASWGADARAIALAHQREAPLDLTLKPGSAPPTGGSSSPPLLLPCGDRAAGSVRYPPGTHVADVPGFAEGRLWVQDAAAALPAMLLGVQPGERVADLCAAPGGKTAQLAATGAHVVAVERDPVRLARLADNLRRWDLPAELVRADVTRWDPGQVFDAVLLDAPCTATGTIRRHPDILHLKRPRDVQTLAAAQDALLRAALALLRPGGRLVYAVCSLQPEEGVAQIRKAMGLPGVMLSPIEASELSSIPEARTAEGFLRTHPGLWPEIGGMDGFFAARLVRT